MQTKYKPVTSRRHEAMVLINTEENTASITKFGVKTKKEFMPCAEAGSILDAYFIANTLRCVIITQRMVYLFNTEDLGIVKKYKTKITENVAECKFFDNELEIVKGHIPAENGGLRVPRSTIVRIESKFLELMAE